LNALRYLPFALRGLAHRGPPLHLTLFVTGRCNARCRHCFHWKEVAAGVAGPSLEQVQSLADSAARLGPLLWVSFGGGEPTSRAEVAAMLVVATVALPRPRLRACTTTPEFMALKERCLALLHSQTDSAIEDAA